MKKSLLSTSLILILALFFTACSGGNESSDKSDEDETTISGNLSINQKTIDINNPEDLSNAISEAMKGLNNGQDVEAVDFRELKKMLPERLAGMNRSAIEGEKTGMGGFKYSIAKAQYKEDNARLDVSIVDGAGFAGVVTGMAAWSMIDVDRETETGYERTTTINGYKAFEKYDSERQEGQISVVVENRFIVNIEGDNLKSDKDLRKALDGLDLKKLKKTI